MRRQQQLLKAGPYGAEVPSNRQLQERLDHGREMRKILVGLYITENISSRKLCDIAHYHTLSGGVGMEDLALKPDDNNSNHNAHVKVVLGNEFGNESLLYVDAPMHDKKERRTNDGADPDSPTQRSLIGAFCWPPWGDASGDTLDPIRHGATRGCTRGVAARTAGPRRGQTSSRRRGSPHTGPKNRDIYGRGGVYEERVL
jgi:hypothetical protein